MEGKKKADIKPFRMGVFARSGGGKSYMTFRYAMDLVKQGFVDVDRVVLISRTWKSDPSQSDFVAYCKKKYPDWVQSNAFEELKDAMELLMGIFVTQKEIKESGKKLKNWLIIYDDQIGSPALLENNITMLQLFTVGRHFGISQIVLLQRFRAVMSVTMRDQFTIVALGRLAGKKSTNDLLDDLDEIPGDPKDSRKQMRAWYQECLQMNEGHGFFVCNLEKNFGEGRYQCGLDGKYLDK